MHKFTPDVGRQVNPALIAEHDRKLFSEAEKNFKKYGRSRMQSESRCKGRLFPSWRGIHSKCFAPRQEAIEDCGLVFRGDSRSPDEIFRTGFEINGREGTIRNDIEFVTAMLQMRLESEVGNPLGFIKEDYLKPQQDTGVCMTESPHVASYFPDGPFASKEVHYVYACAVPSGVKVHQRIFELVGEDTWVIKKMFGLVVAAKEVMTAMVPREHVICAWPCRKRESPSKFSDAYLPLYESPRKNPSTDGCVADLLAREPLPDLEETNGAVVVKVNTYKEIRLEYVKRS